MATTRYPAAARAGSWWRHEYHDSGKPWTSTTSGPSPASTQWMRVPAASTTCDVAPVGSTSFNMGVGSFRRKMVRQVTRGGAARPPRSHRRRPALDQHVSPLLNVVQQTGRRGAGEPRK